MGKRGAPAAAPNKYSPNVLPRRGKRAVLKARRLLPNNTERHAFSGGIRPHPARRMPAESRLISIPPYIVVPGARTRRSLCPTPPLGEICFHQPIFLPCFLALAVSRPKNTDTLV